MGTLSWAVGRCGSGSGRRMHGACHNRSNFLGQSAGLRVGCGGGAMGTAEVCGGGREDSGGVVGGASAAVLGCGGMDQLRVFGCLFGLGEGL